MTNEQILAYYVSLLIMQYQGSTNQQTITFSAIPASGNFQFGFGTISSPNIAWNASNSTIASVLEALTGVASITVTGGLSTGVLNITIGNSPSLILITQNITLEDGSSNPITSVTSGNLVKAAGLIQATAQLAIMNQLPLIIQNAFNLIPTVQTITFSSPPSTGAFALTFSVTSSPSLAPTATGSIPYHASNQTIQNTINAILPSGGCTVSGGIATGSITITFTGVNPSIISVSTNTLGVTASITTNLAYGSQLDTMGKYVGVSRYGFNASGPITLSDSDFYSLIQLGIIKNNFGSSLAQIQTLLHTFFNGQILVFDYANMQMSYLVNTSFLSENLLYCAIYQNLLPRPMAVQLANIIAAPIINNFFSLRTYLFPAVNGNPLNSYSSYQTDWPWLTYSDAIGV